MTTTPCPICQGRAGYALTAQGASIHRCEICDFLFVYPTPTNDEIAAYYAANYRGASSDHYPKLRSRKRRALVKSIRFRRYAHRRKVLDIGCGGGIMADAFRRLGADAHGLDISPNSIEFARKQFPRCTFYCEDFAAMTRRGLIFDFIFTSDVLEHLAGPHECLAMMEALSRPGTIVYVATPDTSHADVPDDISTWVDIHPPEHLQWFNPGNMERLFATHGFTLERAIPKRTAALSMLFRKQA